MNAMQATAVEGVADARHDHQVGLLAKERPVGAIDLDVVGREGPDHERLAEGVEVTYPAGLVDLGVFGDPLHAGPGGYALIRRFSER